METYALTAQILRTVASTGKNLKSIYFKSRHSGNKRIYALATEVLRRKKLLVDIEQLAGITCDTLDIHDEELLHILVYDLLFGRKEILGGGAVKKKLLAKQEQLQLARQALATEDLITETVLPTYVRVNTMKITVDESLVYLRDKGASPSLDDLVPNLICLPLSTPCRWIFTDPWVKNGNLIIQDKASCLPAQLLLDEWKGGDILDACAAPGNKTSQIAALLHNKSKDPSRWRTIAFDKSHERTKTLMKRLQLFGTGDQVVVLHRDFLNVDVNDALFENVRYILTDPSCSGSGIIRDSSRSGENAEVIARYKGDAVMEGNDENTNQLDNDDNDDDDNDDDGADTEKRDDQSRLMKLQGFQCMVLKKAMSFPNVNFIVYSTCSLHRIENEEVVAQALHSEVGSSFQLMEPSRMKDWKRRGSSVPYNDKAATQLPNEDLLKLIRCHPDDQVNGFFVAVFRRRDLLTSPLSQRPTIDGNIGGMMKDQPKKRKQTTRQESSAKKSKVSKSDTSSQGIFKIKKHKFKGRKH